jgi:hypothetical protein
MKQNTRKWLASCIAFDFREETVLHFFTGDLQFRFVVSV